MTQEEEEEESRILGVRMQCSVVQSSTVQCTAVHYSVGQYGKMQHCLESRVVQ